MNIAIILAGGSGSRMGSDIPKQFIDIYGKPLVIHTIESFDINSNIDYIAVVCKKEWQEDFMIWTRKFGINKLRWIIDGGKTRQESILNALEKIKEDCNSDDIVLIHDAARPLISQRIIDDNVSMAKKHLAVDTVISSPDTIVNSKDNETIFNVPLRKELYLGQTPQSFQYGLIYEAHQNARDNKILDATDDCQLILKMQKKVFLVKGDKLNFKITTFEDLLLLKSIIKLGKLEVL
ncbi:2-C-methyl-D-erythritol 4-phosphate cytidylyltransferase [Clostridium perfringens]|uniref:2-C-methyl-D-erythritol 4-phosphate cytidylyltransferase n=1 Tax=Clostridium perfringens TaxID=1502 RepID=UPI00016BC6DA|nr:2-C-methyl-D-erythritol 4-phosphate cytidylyltransferase [Clostridium perfringens]EDT79015.1 2-C-methyl-D-erythritol 4-phosphate cytidylyltransferase [Clostridium perfringens NCTC 8239]ELC8383136.1 2-C-methyl-D-erythritol 4-phosphate cytidylyltransferase [Clostridium perfringens]MCX0358853.1 2-C-methyl-D-erythritol 4-phosphate cytidylyltransferase [Clostridium perfringens]MCX0419100.1 2-C-methyl-D-erythritol 4-phosphate cytidylyltransferase [Clostridium perfringens]MDK0589001.1 2-C-methyl-D